MNQALFQTEGYISDKNRKSPAFRKPMSQQKEADSM